MSYNVAYTPCVHATKEKKKTSQNIKNQVNSNKNNLKFANVFKHVKAKKET